MSDRATIAEMLRTLSGGALQLDDQGQCVMQDPDGLVFRIEVPAAAAQVYWIAPLGAHRGPRDGVLFERLLKESFLALETRGTHLSIDPRAEQIVLWTSLPIEGLAPASLERMTMNFAEFAAEWARRIAEWRQAEPVAPQDDQMPGGEDLIAIRI